MGSGETRPQGGMSYRLVLAAAVRDDIWETHDHIAKDSFAVALRYPGAVETSLAALAEQPFLGSPKPRYGNRRIGEIRIWAVNGFPNHLIVYSVREADVVVFAITHGARHIPRLLRERS
jgi:plasmid stabilization system protein ParE